jgi:hypothetical protein
MSHRSGSVPLSRPQQEMLDHVEALLGRHPRLASAWEAGWSLNIGCDTDAIWATATPPDGGEARTARLATPRWWLPSRSGRALAITEELAESLEREIAAPG